MSSEGPRAEIEAEVLRILELAGQQGVPLRVIGGVAIRLHAGSRLPPSLRREPNDIDLVTLKGKGQQVTALMEGNGYSSDTEFNFTNGHRRLLFRDVANGRQIDVFVGSFEMCHAIPIMQRIDLDPVSIPLAELLLTKLQVVQLNEKDLRDILAILATHPVGDSDAETVNCARVGELLGRDWGLWRTATMNLARAQDGLVDYMLTVPEHEAVTAGLSQLTRRINDEPKTARWRLRARIGDRLRWYEDPEE